MILALLKGRKTQTRRIVKSADKFPDIIKFERSIVDDEPQYKDSGMPIWYSTELDGTTREWGCKFGEVGNRLWVQENYSLKHYRENSTSNLYHCFYTDSCSQVVCLDDSEQNKLLKRKSFIEKKQPGRFMYRSCSRILLEITNIRVERLQDISEEGAIAEGIQPAYGKYWLDYQRQKQGDEFPVYDNPIDSFRSLWESIHGTAGWELNSWLWVVKFKKVEALCQ